MSEPAKSIPDPASGAFCFDGEDGVRSGDRIVPAQFVVRTGTAVKRVPIQRGETILDALRRAEIPIQTQCEKAYCGSCIFQLLQGEVKLLMNDVLSESDLADNMRLACQGVPVSEDVEIELYCIASAALRLKVGAGERVE